MKIYLYITVMAITTYLIRMLPLTLFRKKIKSKFVNSFLYYIPCTCLSAMTFPSILEGGMSVISSVCGLVAAFTLSYYEKSLITVAVSSVITVFSVEKIFVWVSTFM